ncbi:glycosyl transferase [Ktedonobacteria bacterium brp13]|nr:glycosyl transferase [Ktedonobacteria bacterium brp13]
MRIAQVAPPWISIPPQQDGGTETIIYHLVEALHARGHEVTLFAPADAYTSARQVSFIPRSLINEGVPWQANLKAYYHLHKSLEYIAQHDFDIVHTHLSSSGDMYIFPLTAELTIPHITTLHSRFPFDRTTSHWTGDADDYFMEWAQSVPLVTISESARAQVNPQACIAGTVHYGVPITGTLTKDGGSRDPDTYSSYSLPAMPDIYHQHNLYGNYFVWIGHFTYEQGAHLAIEAARRCHVPLWLIGIKESANLEAMHYYQHMVAPFIDNQQIRIGIPATREQKLKLLRQARGLLNPMAYAEPSGFALLEAMSVGCPVISFANGAAAEIITNGKNGFLTHTLQEMTNSMTRITSINRLEVREHIKRHFSTDVMTENYLHLYRNVVDSHTLSQVARPLQRSRLLLTEG